MELGFVHLNNQSRTKMYNMLQLIREHTAIDELGIGKIRDAYSNLLFPGMSTLYRHAKYFVLIPQIYHEAENYDYSNIRDVRAKIIELEIKATRQLLAGSPGVYGITGSEIVSASGAANKSKYVKYDPIYIYTGGLKTFGIQKCENPEQLILAKSRARKNQPELYKTDKEGGSDDSALAQNAEYCMLPEEKLNLNQPISIFLNPVEASFIKNHILSAENSRDSLLAYILRENIEVGEDEEFLPKNVDFDKLSFSDFDEQQLKEPYRKQLIMAKILSRFIVPLNIRFMCNYYRIHEDSEAYEHATNCFVEELEKNKELLNEDIILRVFSFVDLKDESTEQFFLKSIKYIKEGQSSKDFSKLDNLIIQREAAMKGLSRCKLRSAYIYDPNYNKNIQPLDFRWDIVVRFVNEIRKGEQGWQQSL